MSGTESLARIERSPKPNSALFASDGVEIAAKVDVDLPAYDIAPTELFERAVQVCAEQLGVTGKLDLVEKNLSTGQLTPVEYKKGKAKPGNWDKVQLCAQACTRM